MKPFIPFYIKNAGALTGAAGVSLAGVAKAIYEKAAVTAPYGECQAPRLGFMNAIRPVAKRKVNMAMTASSVDSMVCCDQLVVQK